MIPPFTQKKPTPQNTTKPFSVSFTCTTKMFQNGPSAFTQINLISTMIRLNSPIYFGLGFCFLFCPNQLTRESLIRSRQCASALASFQCLCLSLSLSLCKHNAMVSFKSVSFENSRHSPHNAHVFQTSSSTKE